jgi:hypothetical protein
MKTLIASILILTRLTPNPVTASEFEEWDNVVLSTPAPAREITLASPDMTSTENAAGECGATCTTAEVGQLQ